MSYGSIKEFLPDNIPTGASLSAKDISLQGFYAHDLSARWRGGLTFKFLYSSLADYSSIGLAVDAGLSYYNSDKGFSFGFAFKNIGLQVKPYENDRQKMPWDIQAGVSQLLAGRGIQPEDKNGHETARRRRRPLGILGWCRREDKDVRRGLLGR